MLLGLLSCREALERLDDYVDRELTQEEMRMVRRHLRICHECTRKFDTEAVFVQDLRTKMNRLDIPADLAAKISRVLSDHQEDA